MLLYNCKHDDIYIDAICPTHIITNHVDAFSISTNVHSMPMTTAIIIVYYKYKYIYICTHACEFSGEIPQIQTVGRTYMHTYIIHTEIHSAQTSTNQYMPVLYIRILHTYVYIYIYTYACLTRGCTPACPFLKGKRTNNLFLGCPFFRQTHMHMHVNIIIMSVGYIRIQPFQDTLLSPQHWQPSQPPTLPSAPIMAPHGYQQSLSFIALEAWH